MKPVTKLNGKLLTVQGTMHPGEARDRPQSDTSFNPQGGSISRAQSDRYDRLFDRYMATRPGSKAARELLDELIKTPSC